MIQTGQQPLTFLYTGAKELGTTQIAPQISLGGYISNSPIPNDQLYNLFSDVALLSEEKFVTKAVAIINSTKDPNAQILNKIKMWFHNENKEKFFRLEMGVVELNNGEMQLIPNTYATPYGIEFASYYLLPTYIDPYPTNPILAGTVVSDDDLDDLEENIDYVYDVNSPHNIDNYFEFPDGFAPGDVYGIWWKRVIDRKALKEHFKCDNLWEIYSEDRISAKMGGSAASNATERDWPQPTLGFKPESGIIINFDFVETSTTEDGLYLKVSPDSKVIVNS